MKECPICLEEVEEKDFLEYDGEYMCSECADFLSNEAAYREELERDSLAYLSEDFGLDVEDS